MLRKRSGQSVLEYVVVLTAIIGVIVLFARNFLKPKVTSTLENAATQMENEALKIKY